MIYIYTGFNESHFEFRVNQELYGFFSGIIGFIIQKNMGLKTKILSLSIPDAEYCAKTKFHFTGGHFENGGI